MKATFLLALHKPGFREAIATLSKPNRWIITGCLAQPYLLCKVLQTAFHTNELFELFWSPSKMETAKREPWMQGHGFSLGGCLAVTSVSLPGAPGQLDQRQAPFALTMADADFTGLLQCLWRAANQREIMISRPWQPISQLRAFLYRQTIAWVRFWWVTLLSLTHLLCSSPNASRYRPNPTQWILSPESNYSKLLLRLWGLWVQLTSRQENTWTHPAHTGCLHPVFFPPSVFSKSTDFQPRGSNETK